MNPQYPLAVNGIIQAKEIIVNTGWSDYVFESSYRLRPLSEVAAYIRRNHHLPDIPTEADVKEMGVPVGDMESKLLAKVEELTIHMIEISEQNQLMKDENRLLKERLDKVEKDRGDGKP